MTAQKEAILNLEIKGLGSSKTKKFLQIFLLEWQSYPEINESDDERIRRLVNNIVCYFDMNYEHNVSEEATLLLIKDLQEILRNPADD